MQLPFLDRISDLNPQLGRELKGNLTPRNLLLMVGGSLSGQFLFLLMGYEQAGTELAPPVYSSSPYCQSIDYQAGFCDFWIGTFTWLAFAMVFILLATGTYQIIYDLAQEKQRGTLTFIQLSPQSTGQILLGKVLGVPCLVYGAIALALPLHLVAAIIGAIPIEQVLIFYLGMVASLAFWFAIALLVGLVATTTPTRHSTTASLVSMIMILALLMVLMVWSYDASGLSTYISLFSPLTLLPEVAKQQLPWYIDAQGLKWPFFNSPEWSLLGVFLNSGLWLYWLRLALLRHFRNPHARLWSKPQSYGITLCINLSVLGFIFWHPATTEAYGIEFQIRWLWLINLVLMFCWIFVLAVPRQVLLDWMRYRHESEHKMALWREFIWQDASPATIAIALQGILSLCSLLLTASVFSQLEGVTSPAMAAVLALLWIVQLCFYGAIAQWIIFWQGAKHGPLLAVGTMVGLIVLPPLGLSLTHLTPTQYPFLWLFTSMSFLALEHSPSFLTIGFSVLAQLSLVALTHRLFLLRLQHAGRSESQRLWDESPRQLRSS